MCSKAQCCKDCEEFINYGLGREKIIHIYNLCSWTISIYRHFLAHKSEGIFQIQTHEYFIHLALFFFKYKMHTYETVAEAKSFEARSSKVFR